MPLSRTKITIPERRAELLTRPRLLDRLSEILDHRLGLISALAGSGKTSLLVDGAQHSSLPFCWLALDELDRDFQRFAQYFIAALQHRFPDFGAESNASLNALTSPERELESFAITLTNELYDVVDEHFVLVLDDFHLVEDVPFIRNFINRFVQLANENCHLILSSRTLTALPDIALMIARNQVDGLSFDELAFQADEIQALVEQNYQTSIPIETAQEWAEQTEGWITALQLSNLAAPFGSGERARLARPSGFGLPEYLGQQVLDRQPADLRQFLLRSSLLGEFNAEFCEAVLNPFSETPQNWNRLVAEVTQRNLFTLPVTADSKWLRYHHLFQDFLQSRLRAEQPELVEPILRSLAEVYAQQGQWERTYYIYRQIGDQEALANLIERAGAPLSQSGRLSTLQNWLNSLPEWLCNRRPALVSLQGAVDLWLGKPAEGLDCLNQAEAAFRQAGDIAGLALALSRRVTAHRVLGSFDQAIRDADEVLALSENNASLLLERADVQRSKGLVLYRLGDNQHALELLQRALQNFTAAQEIRMISSLKMEIGMVQRSMGNYTVALQNYQHALENWRKEGNLTWQANLLNNLGVLYHTMGEYEQAALAFEQGLACARRSGYVRMEALLLCSLGDLYIDLEESEAASQAFLRALDLARGLKDRFLTFYSEFSQSRLYRMQRDIERAETQLNNVLLTSLNQDSKYEMGLLHQEKGCLALENQDIPLAIQELTISADQFRLGGQNTDLSKTLLWLAAVQARAGNLDAAREHLRQIFSRQQQNATVSLLAIVRPNRPWLEKLVDRSVSGAALANLLRKSRQVEADLASIRRRLRNMTNAVSLPSPHLKILALGPGQVIINDQPITSSDWRTRSVRELFFFFVTQTQPLTKEKIAERFWGEITQEDLKIRFRNEMYRLRKAVGADVVVYDGEDRYMFNRDLLYDYDVEAFEALLTRASSASDVEEQKKHYLAAVNLVRGNYLADIDGEWVYEERERLRKLYMDALLKLAQIHMAEREFSQVIDMCQRAITNDRTCEEAYCILMRVYAMQGDRLEVARQYQRLKAVLDEELGISPSREAEETYRRLTA
ncbi:MAG TPA: tetratricopeptide repeat protein [Anaerolineaceae bacterium]